jgi:hypothetical protein
MKRQIFALALLASSLIAASQSHPRPAAPPKSKATEDSQLYRNTRLGFHFRIPYGWVDRTTEMSERNTPVKPDAESEKTEAREKPGAAKGEVLLAVFERPPEAIGDTINSAVVIAAENAAAYPGLKKAEDYVGALTELITSKGFKVDGEPSVLEIDSRQLVCLESTKPLNETLTMHQATLILLTKGQIVTFTFIAGSQDEVDNRIDGLYFGEVKSSAY